MPEINARPLLLRDEEIFNYEGLLLGAPLVREDMHIVYETHLCGRPAQRLFAVPELPLSQEFNPTAFCEHEAVPARLLQEASELQLPGLHDGGVLQAAC